MAADSRHGALLGSVLGGYQLVELIGVGGMAEVYRGVLPPDIAVAVKVLPAELASDPGYVARFRVEAKRAAALKHPNIVPVLHFGEERNALFIVMPLLRTSLRERMDHDGPYDPLEAITIALDIASALDAAHTFGIMHRDVKPENILLGGHGTALLTDFGIARDLDMMGFPSAKHTLSITGLPVGTPEYMAPEQLSGAAFDQRVDIYSLGVVLYEMMTGIVPHDASTPLAVAARVLHEKVPPPSMHRPAIWPALDRAVLTAMASDPNDRYPDMRSFANGLRWAHEQRQTASAPYTLTRDQMPASIPAPVSAPLAAMNLAASPASAAANHANNANTAIDTRPTQPMPLTGGWSVERGWRAPLEWLRTTPRSPLMVGLVALLFVLLLVLCVLAATLIIQAVSGLRPLVV